MKEEEKADGPASRILFVVNPKSGNGKDYASLKDLILAHSKANYFSFDIYEMRGNDSDRIKSRIKDYQPTIVAAAGGDGTVKMVAEILGGTELTMAIIPVGSANGMAKELNIGGRVEPAIELLTTHQVRAIDLLLINGEICIHLADMGLNARVVKRFESDKKRGILTYAKHLFGEMFLLKHYRFTVNYDGKTRVIKAVSITFANASKYGTGAVINPEGKLDDGRFELVLVKPFPNVKLLSIAWKMFLNKLHTSDYVEILSCTKAHVVCSRKSTLQIDGEVIGKVKEIDVSIMKGALKIIVPRT